MERALYVTNAVILGIVLIFVIHGGYTPPLRTLVNGEGYSPSEPIGAPEGDT